MSGSFVEPNRPTALTRTSAVSRGLTVTVQPKVPLAGVGVPAGGAQPGAELKMAAQVEVVGTDSR